MNIDFGLCVCCRPHVQAPFSHEGFFYNIGKSMVGWNRFNLQVINFINATCARYIHLTKIRLFSEKSRFFSSIR